MTANAGSPVSVDSLFRPSRQAIGIWLLIVAALVVAMVMLGGATRLTNSGLSMVHWKFAGALPPMDQASWEAEFSRYQQFPEYRKINAGMTLPEFQRIYWFEYSHRMLGRFIGLVFAVPLLWFLVRRQLDPGLFAKLMALLVLGGLQALVGWWMVKSGLVDHPDVSHYRLSTHLGLAILLFAALLWVGFGQFSSEPAPSRPRPLKAFGWLLFALVFLQVVLGGMVAGLNAGLVYNTFPTMGGYWLPPEVTQTGLTEIFDEPVALQFMHRLGALAVMTAGIWYWVRLRRLHPDLNGAANLLLCVLVAQIALGIATLLAAVPIGLALAHQAGALALLASILWLQHRLN